MTRNTNRALRIAGTALCLCLPAFVIFAGIRAWFTPREYYSETTVELRNLNEAAFTDALSVAVRPYRGWEAKGVSNTNLYEIGVQNSDPQQAADTANLIAAALQKQFNTAAPPEPPAPAPLQPASEAERRAAAEKQALDQAEAGIKAKQNQPAVVIWEKAVPATKRSRPDILSMVMNGIAAGLLPALLGAILLFVAYATGPRVDRHLTEAEVR